MTKNIFLLLFLIITSNIFPENKLNYKEIHENFFPRDEGTANEYKLKSYIEEQCKLYDLNFTSYKIDNEKDIITNSYNIEILLKGNSTATDKLVIIFPLNNPIIKKQNYDNSITIEILLDLILLCKNMQFQKDIVFLISGANESENTNYYGIKYFINKNNNLENSFVTVINILSNKSTIKFSGSINGKSIPLTILKSFFKLDKKDLDINFDRSEVYRSRFNVLPEDDYVSFFINENINAVSFTNKDQHYLNNFFYDKEYQETLTDYFFSWIQHFDKINFPIKNDYHYLYYNLFNITIFIPELIQAVFFIILVLLAIILRLFFPNFQKFHFHLFFKVVIYFFIIFFLYYILSFIPYIIFYIIGIITGLKNAFLNSPVTYFINIFLTPLLLIFIIIEFFKTLQITKHSFLLIFGAYVFSFVNIFLSMIIDISIVQVYLLTIIIILISQFTGKNFLLKSILYILSPIPLILLVSDLIFSKNMNIIIRFNPLIINLIFCAASFPFILLYLRLLKIFKIKYKIFYKKIPIFFMIFFTILISLIIIVIVSLIKIPQIEEIKANAVFNVNSDNNYLLLKSEKKIGTVIIENDNTENEYHINKNDSKIMITSSKLPYEINYKIEEDEIQKFYFDIQSEYPIEYFNFYLIAPKDHYPIESNLAFHELESFHMDYTPEKESVYSFIFGRNPGEEILFNIGVLKGSYKFYLEFEYPFINDSFLKIKKSNCFINDKSIFIDFISID